MIERLFNFILICSYLFPLSIVLLKFFNKVKLSTFPIFIILYCSCFFFLLNIYEEIPKAQTPKRIYDTVFTFLEYSFFTFIIWLNIINKVAKKIIIATSILFVAFQISYFFLSEHKKLDSIPIGVETILIFVYIFFFLFEQFKKQKSQYINNNYCFWLAVGMMIYLAGSFFFYILANLLETEQIDSYWKFSYLADIAKNILFTIGTFFFFKQPNENKTNKKTIPYLDLT